MGDETKDEQMVVRLPSALLERLDAYAERMRREMPGPAWKRSDVVRIRVSKAWDYEEQVIKPTKTWESRDVPIEPTLLPLLKAMHQRAKGKGLVLPLLSELADEFSVSRMLRTHLETAGVTRPDLFASGDPVANTRQIATRFRSLRDWGITWRLWRGDNPFVVQRNAGHKRFSTTEKYIADVEKLSPECGVPFPLLASKFASKESEPTLQPTGTSDENGASPGGFAG